MGDGNHLREIYYGDFTSFVDHDVELIEITMNQAIIS